MVGEEDNNSQETQLPPAADPAAVEESSADVASAEEQELPVNMAVSGEINDNLKWYVLHTYSGYEEKAKKALIQRSKEKGLDKMVGSVHIPQTHKETTTKTGKKRIVSRTSFPGYVMAQLDLDDQVKVLVTDTPKITGFVGNSRYPKPLPDREVRAMLFSTVEASADEDGAPSPTYVQQDVRFSKGDAVKVIEGPFSNFDGVIDEVRPEKARVRVLVSIFGRETPVELEYGQVEEV